MTSEWGPLAGLIGEWQGEGGLDRAYSHSQQKVLDTPYLEKVTFIRPKRPYAQQTPFGKLPAIRDGDIEMFESGAILEYILERYGRSRLAPEPGTPLRAPFLQWVHFSEATIMPPLGQIVWHTMFKPEEGAAYWEEAKARPEGGRRRQRSGGDSEG